LAYATIVKDDGFEAHLDGRISGPETNSRSSRSPSL
jgi:hypothetical protein